MVAALRWGIVGTGFVARRFAASLKLCEGARIVAVASKDVTHASAFARDFGVERVHATFEELAMDPDLDVVYVATPIGLHAQHTQHCLESGKAVLCEKPLALSAREAEESVEVARRTERFLMEGMWMRFVPLITELRDQVHAGAIGALRMLQADLSFPTPFDPEDPRFDLESGGGALLSLGVYPVSLAFDFLGAPQAVEGRTVFTAGGVDRQATILLSYADAQAVLTCGFHGRGRNDAALVGERGSIRIEAPLYGPEAMLLTSWPPARGAQHKRSSERLQERLPHAARIQRRLLPSLRRVVGRDRRIRRPYASFGYQFEAAEVGRCLREGCTESTVMPLDETVAVLDVLDRVRRLASNGHTGGSNHPDGSRSSIDC